MDKRKKRHRESPKPPGRENSTSGRSRRKTWVFRFSALILVPVLVLLLCEILLRLGHYGLETSYFTKSMIQGQSVLVPNEDFSRRFFPKELARSPNPQVITAQKPTETIRIFVFGESAALGDPKPSAGFWRYLETLLENRHPDQQFEVVCVAMTAINSHVILPIARECAQLNGDLWILYMGNNEMAGPFGASTVFGSKTPPLFVIRGFLSLMKLRTFQWVRDGVNRFTSKENEPVKWEGLKMFEQNTLPPDHPGREIVYRHFTSNLAGILQVAKENGIAVLAGEVVSNLIHCGPFASLNSISLSPQQQEEFQKRFKIGVELQEKEQFSQAVTAYHHAAKIDDAFAELQFRLGQCQLEMGQAEEALTHFRMARDRDGLPFRADQSINQALESEVKLVGSDRIRYVDTYSVLKIACRDQIPGNDIFFDQVHFNFEGNYRLALGFAEKVEELLFAQIDLEKLSPWSNRKSCDKALALTAWNQREAFVSMMRRMEVPPFNTRTHHSVHQALLAQQLAGVENEIRPDLIFPARDLYERAIQGNPDDFRLRENYAEFLEITGDQEECLAQWSEIHRSLPTHFGPFYHMGLLERKLGKLDEAMKHLETAFKYRPESLEIRLEIGQCLSQLGQNVEAQAHFEKMSQHWPDHAGIQYQWARTLAKLNRRDEALEKLRKTVELQPQFWQARYLLGVELVADGHIKEAAQEFHQVTRIQPEYTLAHYNLGIAFARLGDMERAILEFEEVMVLDPTNQEVLQKLDLARDLLEKARESAAFPENQHP